MATNLVSALPAEVGGVSTPAARASVAVLEVGATASATFNAAISMAVLETGIKGDSALRIEECLLEVLVPNRLPSISQLLMEVGGNPPTTYALAGAFTVEASAVATPGARASLFSCEAGVTKGGVTAIIEDMCLEVGYGGTPKATQEELCMEVACPANPSDATFVIVPPPDPVGTTSCAIDVDEVTDCAIDVAETTACAYELIREDGT